MKSLWSRIWDRCTWEGFFSGMKKFVRYLFSDRIDEEVGGSR